MAIVGVRFLPTGKVHYFDPGELALEVGDRVEVQEDSGTRRGSVAIAPGQVLYSEVKSPLPPVVRKLAPEST